MSESIETVAVIAAGAVGHGTAVRPCGRPDERGHVVSKCAADLASARSEAPRPAEQVIHDGRDVCPETDPGYESEAYGPIANTGDVVGASGPSVRTANPRSMERDLGR